MNMNSIASETQNCGSYYTFLLIDHRWMDSQTCQHQAKNTPGIKIKGIKYNFLIAFVAKGLCYTATACNSVLHVP